MRLSLKQVFVGLGALALVGIVVIAYLSSQNLKQGMLDERKDKAKQVIVGLINTMDPIVRAYSRSEIDRETALQRLANIVGYFTYEGSGYIFADDFNGCNVSHVKKERIGTCSQAESTRNIIQIAKAGGGFLSYLAAKPNIKDQEFPKVAYVQAVPKLDIILGTGLYLDDIDEIFQERLITLAGIGLLVTLIIAVIGFYFSRQISLTVDVMADRMKALSDGDTTVRFNVDNKIKEFDRMIEALRVFRRQMQENQRIQDEKRDLAAQHEQDRLADRRKLASEFDQNIGSTVRSVSEAVEHMTERSAKMNQVAQEARSKAQTVAGDADIASQNVTAVSSATEQLSASIDEIARLVEQASEVTNQAVDQSKAANARVRGLVSSTDQVGEVVTLITDIANQTNLLALNATIEAARAGEMGKGFAVVASEVKNLANQTAKATDEIAQQIATIQADTQHSVEAIETIGTTISSINEISTTISASVEQQGVATQEISRSVQIAAEGTSNVMSNILEVSEASDFAEETAKAMQENVGSIREQMTGIKRDVDAFITVIRDQ